jgi:iron(II)-dependent oxidoreductase
MTTEFRKPKDWGWDNPAMETATADQTAAAGVVDALDEARARTLKLVEPVSDDDLEKVHSTLMSPLVWDLGHIAAFEDLWLVHRFGGKPLLHDHLADVYDAFETPRAGRGELPFLRPAQAREYLAQTRERTLETIAQRGVGDVHEMVIRHEQQHNETMLQTIQLARLERYRLGTAVPSASQNGGRDRSEGGGGLELLEIPAGPCTIGAVAEGFAYDNERPRHRTDVRAYLIGRTPITNASYLTFVEGGGYQRREWWSDEGWAWKEEYDITRPAGWTADLESEWRLESYQPLDPDHPVVHVSWFEADAFARAHGARLPTEIEWEKAATWDQETATGRVYPWGSEPLTPALHANVDHTATGPERVGRHPDASSPFGLEDLIGDVWEWTSSDFTGYAGFTAYPYREYSEVFFGSAYKVLRGGSWATRARTITPTFRNWDYPLRRQIFAGFRIAKEVQA